MSGSLSSLQPDLQPFARALIDAAGAAGLQPRVTSTLRSRGAQERLYRRFLAGLQPYPVARPGTSAHEYGWAFDMVVSPMEALAEVGAYWEGMGGVWGGHPTRYGSSYDPVHFEYPAWRETVRELPPARSIDTGHPELGSLLSTAVEYSPLWFLQLLLPKEASSEDLENLMRQKP